jgi:hypothetical protein
MLRRPAEGYGVVSPVCGYNLLLIAHSDGFISYYIKNKEEAVGVNQYEQF